MIEEGVPMLSPGLPTSLTTKLTNLPLGFGLVTPITDNIAIIGLPIEPTASVGTVLSANYLCSLSSLGHPPTTSRKEDATFSH